jgi:hypothetical protein
MGRQIFVHLADNICHCTCQWLLSLLEKEKKLSKELIIDYIH